MQNEQRADTETAQQIKEAQMMERAFGREAAQAFLNMRRITPSMVQRILTEPERRRQF